MSYAGFQRSEVPNIGKDVAGIMQHQMDVQAKEDLQQKALIAKGLVNDQKVARENEKANIKLWEPINKAKEGIPKTPSAGINQIGNMVLDSVQTLGYGIVGDKSLSDSEKTNEMNGVAKSVTDGAFYMNKLKTAEEKISALGVGKNPMAEFAVRRTNKYFEDPNNFSISLDKIGRGTYNWSAKRQGTDKEIFNGEIAQNLDALVNSPVPDFATDFHTQVNNIGKIEIEKPDGKGGTKLIVDTEHNPKFLNQLNTYTNQLLENKVQLGNAMVKLLDGRPMLDDANNVYKVIYVDPTTTDAEKEQLAKERGTTSDGKGVMFVEIGEDKNGFPIANPTDAQKEVLKSSIKNDWVDYALYKQSIAPSRDGNGDSNSKANDNKESYTIQRVRAGDERAISAMVDQIPHIQLNDTENYHYNPKTGILTLKIKGNLTDEYGKKLNQERQFNLKNEGDMRYLMRLYDEPKAKSVEKYSNQ
jgi:hypothetical protein